MPCDGPLQLATAAFTARFGGEPAVMASAPGRVELLGNHTDYNGGLVIAAAIDRRTVFVGRRSPVARRESRRFSSTISIRSRSIISSRTEAGRVDSLRPRSVLGISPVARSALFRL